VNFELDIPTLERATTQIKSVITELVSMRTSYSGTGKSLTATGWKGTSANSYNTKFAESVADLSVHINNWQAAQKSISLVLTKAKALHKQALSFASIFGGSATGALGKISFYPADKATAVSQAKAAINRWDDYNKKLSTIKGQLDNFKTIGSVGVSYASNMQKNIATKQQHCRRLISALDAYEKSVADLAKTMQSWATSFGATRNWNAYAAAILPAITGFSASDIAKLAATGELSALLAFLLGVKYSCTFGGDPVNMATGNFIYTKEYLNCNGAFPLSLKLFYNSQNKETGSLGAGWVHNFEARAQKDDNQAEISFGDGHKEIFIKASSGVWHPAYGTTSTLKTNASGLIYQTLEGLGYDFDKDGRLSGLKDTNGNFAHCIYDEAGTLSAVENNTGAQLVFAYEGDQVVAITDHSGRQIKFDYKDDHLVAVTDEEGGIYNFAYDAAGTVSQITNPENVEALVNKYDNQQRPLRQNFADGGAITYSYDDEAGAVCTIEQNGNEVTYIHDDKYRSTETIYFDGTEKTSFNDRNLPTAFTDKRGNTTHYVYDKAGNLTQTTNALEEVVTATFDEGVNKPVEIKLQDQMIFGATYDGAGNPLELLDGLNRLTRLDYNSFGQPEKIILPDKSEITLTYDEGANIASITDFYGTTAYSYSNSGQVTSSTDPLGNTICYEYNAKGDLTCVINAAGDKRHYTYNKLGKIIKVIDFDDTVVTWTYTPLGKVATITDQEQATTKFIYDLMGDAVQHIDALGHVTHFEYDLLRRMTRVTDATGAVVAQYEYDAAGNRTKIIDALGAETSLVYDALNRLTAVTEADGATTTAAYNVRGQVIELTDGAEHIWKRSYDAAGQLITETDPTGAQTTYTYSELGRIATVTDPAGRFTIYDYLPGGLLSKVTNADATYSTYTYNAVKQLISTTNQDDYSLYYEYDCLGSITKISSSTGQEMAYTYDAVGNVISTTDANGNTTRFTWTPAGRLATATDASGTCTEYSYDVLGEVIAVEQLAELEQANKVNGQNAQPRVIAYQRNALGQIETITDVLGQSESYTYDPAGNPLSKLDKEGFLTKYTYNLTGQPDQIDYADGKSVVFTYNALRQLTQVKDWLGVTDIEVDAFGRALKITDPQSREVSYTYGQAGERTSITYPDGKTVNYNYDSALRLSNLTDGDLSVDYTYDQASRLIEKVFSNGTAAHYDYNEMGVLAELTHTDAQGMLDHYIYGYDSMLNKTSIKRFRRDMPEVSGSYTYGYDSLSRLAEVTKDGTLQKTYGYDPFGNRSFMQEAGNRTDYTYNVLNQLIRTEGPEQTRDYIYDARGNLTQVLKMGKTVCSYEYGALGRLTKAIDATGKIASYDYNGLGQRTGQQIEDGLNPTKHIGYLLDQTRSYNNLLAQDDEGQIKSYLWDGEVVAESSASGMSMYLKDELGSPIRFIGADGGILDSYAYDEFGVDVTGNQGTTQPFGYTGYSFDAVAGTYFAQARNFDPITGRFFSEDPIHSGGNWYSYCESNPLVFVDPLGLEEIVISGGIYNKTKVDNGKYYYEFLDAGLAQIKQLKKQNNGEMITWVVADYGWSEWDKSAIKKTATSNKVNLVFVTNKTELFNYLNYASKQPTPTDLKNGSVGFGREMDPITNLSTFSHGLIANGGTLSLGYNAPNSHPKELDITSADLWAVFPQAFASNHRSNFFSCNLGTAGWNSFAQQWANLFGGTTTAYIGQTDYSHVSDNMLWSKLLRLYTETLLGHSMFGGSVGFPESGDGAMQQYFYQNNSQDLCPNS